MIFSDFRAWPTTPFPENRNFTIFSGKVTNHENSILTKFEVIYSKNSQGSKGNGVALFFESPCMLNQKYFNAKAEIT